MDKEDYIGRSVNIYDPILEEWNRGVIENYFPGKGYHVQFYDGNNGWYPDFEDHIVTFDDNNVSPLRGSQTVKSVTADELEILDRLTDNLVDNINKSMDISNPSSPKRGNFDASGSLQILTASQSKGVTSPVRKSNTNLKKSTDSLQLSSATSLQMDIVNGLNTIVPECTSESIPVRGILMFGQVVGLSDRNEAKQAFKSTVEGGGYYFKVFYQETSGIAPTKSVIFTSGLSLENSPFTYYWNAENSETAGLFTFEMILPAHVMKIGGTSESGDNYKLNGEISVVFYRMRSVSGASSDLVGQTTFSLNDVVKKKGQSGATKRRNYTRGDDIVDCGMVESIVPLCGKTGKSLENGMEASIRVDIFWRASEFSIAAPIQDAPLSKTRPSSATLRNSKSFGEHVAEQREVIEKAEKAEVKKSVRPVSANATTKKNTSSRGKVNKEMQWKIDQENKAMLARLSKLGTSAAKANIQNTSAYAKNSKPPTRAEVRAKMNAAEESVPYSDRFKDTEEKTAAKENYKALLAAYNEVKGEVAALEVEFQEVKAQALKNDIEVKKFGIITQRMRSRGAGPSVPGAKNSLPPTQNEDILSKYEPQNNSVVLDARVVPPAPGDYIEKLKASEMSEMQRLTVSDDGVDDVELQETFLEYIVLQESRRSLVKRIAFAKQHVSDHEKEAGHLKSKEQLVKQRILGVSESAASLKSEGKSKIRADNPNYDINLRVRAKELAAEITALENTLGTSSHILKVTSECEDSLAVMSHLTGKCTVLSASLNKSVYDRDILQEKLRELHEGDEVTALRAKITSLRGKILKIQSSQSQASLKG